MSDQMMLLTVQDEEGRTWMMAGWFSTEAILRDGEGQTKDLQADLVAGRLDVTGMTVVERDL